MSSVKAVFLDIDGTLVDSSGQIPTSATREISRLNTLGVTLSLATGRPYFATYDIIDQLSITAPSMFCSGATIVDPSSTFPLVETHLPPGQIELILELSEKNDWYIELYSHDAYFVERFSHFTEIHKTYLSLLPTAIKLRDLSHTTKILKVVLVSERNGTPSQTHLQTLLPDLTVAVGYGASHPNITFVNLTSKKANRASAFAKLIELIGINAENVLACGDAEADIPFIQSAGIGVAMGNAPQEVRDQADYVTDVVENEGLAKALRKFV